MRPESIDTYMEPLLSGNRLACREIIRTSLESCRSGREVYERILWPAMERVEKLFRGDRISTVVEHMATRINRSLADQLQQSLPKNPAKGKRILIMCADGEPEELGGQMCADLFEADGWDACFIGGGVPHDEVTATIGRLRPDVLLIFGTQPRDVPRIRELVDRTRDIGANPAMNIMVSGGVFNRADGLWKEINADLFAPTIREAIEIANTAEPRPIEARIPGTPKKRRRRRAVAMTGAEA